MSARKSACQDVEKAEDEEVARVTASVEDQHKVDVNHLKELLHEIQLCSNRGS